KCLKGDLTERRTKRGKSFFGCIRYPDCDYSTWNRPTPEQCPECKWVGMEKKVSKALGERLICMKCGHEEQVLEPEEVS
ncbi:MAG: DNA topoisomerase I, partial [Gemmatimonadales bacterium]|nr:DNA topoisomerase I [Gemmatimonadales bacterium]